jgi:hypothetical protein
MSLGRRQIFMDRAVLAVPTGHVFDDVVIGKAGRPATRVRL